MDSTHSILNPLRPRWAFYAGLTFVMLVLWMSFIPDWLTFVHIWKVELFASIFLGSTVVFAYLKAERIDFRSTLSQDEIRYILLPILAFTLWSAVSAFWASSWRSAIHHTLVWSLYLIFFCIVRYSLNQAGQYRKFLILLAGSLVLCSVPAISGYVAFQLFGGSTTLGIRFSRFGEQVATLLPLVLVGVLRLRSKRFAVGVLAVCMLWLLVFSSMSRAGMLMFVTATLSTGAIVLINHRLRVHRWKYAVVVAVLVLAPLTLLSLSPLSSEGSTPTVSRLSDSQGVSNSNDFRKLMIALSLEMFMHAPIVGVGADNFGFEAHNYRAVYAQTHPDDPLLAQAESDIPERAHNEYLQILAELGIVGSALFGWFLCGIGIMAFRALRGMNSLPVHAPAAVIGLGMFLLGGLVTSYSFRLIQNGFVFFFVLAVASKLLLSRKGAEENTSVWNFSVISAKPALALGILACLLLFGYSAMRVSSVIVTERANSTMDAERAFELYKTAARIDSENPFATRYHGMRLLREQRFAEAVPHLSNAIAIGLTPSDSYSYLATSQTMSGDHKGAEETMRQASVVYPHSVFVLIRYGILQRANGNHAESSATLELAERLGAGEARTWRTMIDEGFRVASSKQGADEYGLVPVMDLKPEKGIFAVLTERLIKFPEEQRFSLFRAVNSKRSADEPGFDAPK
ncbi:MAG: O-antigen ligase family protein [Pyrinomonadaceae bacterium]